MKKIAILATLALSSVGAAHAASPNVYTVQEMLKNYQSGAQFVNGYVAGIAEADDKVCTGAVHFGTLTAQVISSLQAAIDQANATDSAKLRDYGAASAVGYELETMYPCKAQ
jgi:hypothetical protein